MYGRIMTKGTRTDTVELMAPRVAAALLGVTSQTVGHWASSGHIRWVRLPSGHRRYVAADVRALRDSASDADDAA